MELAAFKADLHIHSLLSPCGDLDMSPQNIIQRAFEEELNIIAITDHNTTRQSKIIRDIAKPKGITVFCGAEVTTKEEGHCLALFDDDIAIDVFQNYLDEHLPNIKNNVKYFGYQIVVDEQENIIYEEERLLISAINQSVKEIEKKIHELNGIFIPAHIDKTKFSILSQLGFLPSNFGEDALEISKNCFLENFLTKNKYLSNKTFIRNSDAHFPYEIGSSYTIYNIETPTIAEIKLSFENKNGRNLQIFNKFE